MIRVKNNSLMTFLSLSSDRSGWHDFVLNLIEEIRKSLQLAKQFHCHPLVLFNVLLLFLVVLSEVFLMAYCLRGYDLKTYNPEHFFF